MKKTDDILATRLLDIGIAIILAACLLTIWTDKEGVQREKIQEQGYQIRELRIRETDIEIELARRNIDELERKLNERN